MDNDNLKKRAELRTIATFAVNRADLQTFRGVAHTYATLAYLTGDVLQVMRDGSTPEYRFQLGEQIAAVGLLLMHDANVTKFKGGE